MANRSAISLNLFDESSVTTESVRPVYVVLLNT